MLTRSKYKRLRGEVQAENVIDESVKFLEKDRDELKRINKDLIRCNDALQKQVQEWYSRYARVRKEADRLQSDYQRSLKLAHYFRDEFNKLTEEHRRGIWVFGRRVYGGGEPAESREGDAGSREGESVDSVRCAVV
jgi:hypothetical protein